MLNRTENRSDRPVALITGSSRGLGRAIAEHLIDDGYTVVGCSRGDSPWSDDQLFHHSADVTDESQIKALFSWINREFGRLDVLINNAGVASMNSFMLTPTDSIRRVMDVNVIGGFVVAREAAKLMMKRRNGRVVNFSTVAVPMALAGEAAYVASKAAVEAFTRVLAQEVGEYGITCNAIAPSPILTDLIKGVPPEKIAAIVDRLAIKRTGTVEDVTAVIDFFLSPGAAYVTGQTIYLGGPA